jgi:Carboxypeptidase regulatory-like domain
MRCALGLPILLLAVSACMPRGPVLDTSEAPAGVGGTISGTVRGSGDTISLAGRRVTAINLDTGEKHETSTAVTGGYTMKVPRGRYRLEVELRPNESLSEQPGELEINTSDMDADRDFVITVRSQRFSAAPPIGR